MKKQFFAIVIAMATLFASTSAVNPALAASPKNIEHKLQAGATVPISGTVAGISSFLGSFDVQRFIVKNGQLTAVGTLTGTLTNLITGATRTVSRTLQIPVVGATGSCEILDLVLGPLDLNLLGLQVHLDQVHLNITAQSGPGQLLGNLLCAVANLLNGGSPLSSLVGLLNQILGQL